jgi:hypothetical protein
VLGEILWTICISLQLPTFYGELLVKLPIHVVHPASLEPVEIMDSSSKHYGQFKTSIDSTIDNNTDLVSKSSFNSNLKTVCASINEPIHTVSSTNDSDKSNTNLKPQSTLQTQPFQLKPKVDNSFDSSGMGLLFERAMQLWKESKECNHETCTDDIKLDTPRVYKPSKKHPDQIKQKHKSQLEDFPKKQPLNRIQGSAREEINQKSYHIVEDSFESHSKRLPLGSNSNNLNSLDYSQIIPIDLLKDSHWPKSHTGEYHILSKLSESKYCTKSRKKRPLKPLPLHPNNFNYLLKGT